MTCPYCKNMAGDLTWDGEARILSGRGAVAKMSRMQARVFTALWDRRSRGVQLSARDMMKIVYADDPSGGPDSENVCSVIIAQQIKPKLSAFNITIERGRIIDLQTTRTEAA